MRPVKGGYAADMRSLTLLAISPVVAAAFLLRASSADESVTSMEQARALEARYRQCANSAVPATVAVIMRGPRGGRTSTGSGTIISDDGWIVTAGHVGDAAGKPCTILLHDGTELNGVTAGMVFNGRRDWGLIKADPKDVVLSVAPMRDPSSLQAGAWVCAIGHTYGPESEEWMPPAIRMGRLLAQDNATMLVDAPFASGDSGGGVFTADGELIGIVSSAGQLSWESTATSLTPVLEDMERLKSELPAHEQFEKALKAAASAAQDDARAGEADASGGGMPTPEPEQQGSEGQEAPDAQPGERGAQGEQGEQQAPQGRRRGGRGPSFQRTAEMEDAVTRESRAVLASVAPAAQAVDVSVATVYVHNSPVALATILDGGALVLTKASELPRDGHGIFVGMPDGEMVDAVCRGIAPLEDLALLEVGAEGHTGVDFVAAAFGPNNSALDEGLFVVSPGADGAPMAVGAIGVTSRTTSRRDVMSTFLGVGVRPLRASERTEAGVAAGVRITAVTPGSPAEAAGVRAGDVVTAVGGRAIASQVELGMVVREHAVGEPIVFDIVRDGAAMQRAIRGSIRPRESGPPPSSEDAPVSRRTSGFGHVIQHDSVLSAREMGGPLVALDGTILGVNIARVDRTRTYALDAARVAQAIAAMRTQMAAGATLLLEVTQEPATALEATSDTTLHPAIADVQGRLLRYSFSERGRDQAGSVGGFEIPEDRMRWTVAAPAAGRYKVDLLYSLPGERTGPPERVSLSRVGSADEAIEVALKKTIRGRFIRAFLGDLELPEGTTVIELRAIDAPASLAVRSLILSPMDSSSEGAAAADLPSTEPSEVHE